MKTVLITGCSSGYGLETGRYFLAKGWRAYEEYAHGVFAGMTDIRAVTTASDVAESVWSAANDTSDRLHFAAGADAVALAKARQSD